MRIACIHIPQFALQCATRLDPSLRGAPVAVVSGADPGRERSGVLHAPIVLACSRAAWALGVRLGMTATAARGLSADLMVVTAESTLEREAVRALGDSLLAVTPVVDLGGRVGAGGAHLAMYAEVPAKTRGTSFGDRLLDLLEELGFAARIGIADDRFTAWVAAAYSGAPVDKAASARGGATTARASAAPASSVDDRGVVSVPRGGSAAFLSPRPLSLLAITPEVQHMLEALGVRTLGEFAALPAPSVSRPLEADYQGLARGDSGSQLRPYTPDAPIREEVVVSAGNVLELEGSVGGPAAIGLIAHRLEQRLTGRGRAAARIEVVALRDGLATEIPVELDHAIETAEELARSLAPVLDATVAAQGAWRLRVLVAGEAVVGVNGEVSEVFAEGSSPFARVADTESVYASLGYNNVSTVGRMAAERTSVSSRVRADEATMMGRMSAAGSSSGRGATTRSTGHGSSTHSTFERVTPDSGALFARLSSRDEAVFARDTSGPRAANDERAQTYASRDAADQQDSESDDSLSPLAVVLSSTGSLFALSPPSARSERRDAHRRTRRGKVRRTRPTALVQARLFDRSSSK